MQKIIFPLTLAIIFVPFTWLTRTEANRAEERESSADLRETFDGPMKPSPEVMAQKIVQARNFCIGNGLNTQAAILVDLGLHSGYFRCWVVRLSDGAIRLKGMVTHGSGKNEWLPMGQRKYSNVSGSLLSSLGKYKTGISYLGEFGLAYKLHGLDSSNSNAFKRCIVLHGHACVPDEERPFPLCQSWGCPTVSSAFLKSLQAVIDASQEPILLWVYDSVNE